MFIYDNVLYTQNNNNNNKQKNNNNDNNNNNNNNEYERMTCVLYDACKLIKLMNCITNNEHVYKLTDGS